MADPVGTNVGEDAYGYYVTTEVPTLVQQLVQIQRLCADYERKTGLKEWLVARNNAAKILDFTIESLNRVSKEVAAYSVELIIAAIHRTASPNRPQGHNMEDHIVSVAGPLGSVQVALTEDLDLIRNPGGYGTFWRAQEYGTGSDEVPTQVGRVLFGLFEPSHTAPDETQRGLGAGHDLAFHTDYDDPDAGFGTIGVDLPGRHFLRDGTEAGGLAYEQQMDNLQAIIVKNLGTLLEQIRALLLESRGVLITAILDA